MLIDLKEISKIYTVGTQEVPAVRSISMFGLVGCLSILELIPGADFFPVFVLTWIIWYYRKKMREKMKREKMRKKWM